MKKIRIAFFAEILIEDVDGASRTMFQLIQRIPKNKFTFLFICGVGPNAIEGFECMKIPAITIPINMTYKMAIPWFSGRRMRNKLQLFQPDIIHIATPSALGEFALKYANQNRIPVLTIYHTHFISYTDYYLKFFPPLVRYVRSMVAKTLNSFYNRCDRVYVPSEEMRSELLSWQVNPDRLQIWQRGINTHLFSPAKKKPTVMQQLTGNNRPVILFASRLVWEKNLETLCGIYQGIQDKHLGYNLVIVGDGVAMEECQQRMPEAIFTGKLDHDHLSVLYASADVFLFPSISESYGSVVPEAMASGLPCVIADGGGSRNFIHQGINGFLCEPNEPEDYLNRITLLLEDEPLRRKIIREGLHFTQSLSWDDLAATYFDDLKQMDRKQHQLIPETL